LDGGAARWRVTFRHATVLVLKEVTAMATLTARGASEEEARRGRTPVTSVDEVVAHGSGALDTAGGIVRFTLGRSRGTTIFAAGIARFPLGSPNN
jgi:hypothetical protein